MIPIVTPDEMRAIDHAAPEPVEELIARAGAAVARRAITMLGGRYGRVVHVLAGKGNNGADGRDAAARLRAQGVRVEVSDAADCPDVLPAVDLVIDAAYGTGYSGGPGRVWSAPDVRDAVVLAVDIPSGLDALTGTAHGRVLPADSTVTFQALKPGLLFGDGVDLAGDIHVVDIGLDVGSARAHLVERSDVAAWWPRRAVDAHKWRNAVKVIAGSPMMPGAAELCSAAAARGGSGLVSLSSPGCRPATRSEIVQRHIPGTGFAAAALADIDRFGALVIGPGMGREDDVMNDVRSCIEMAAVPTVIDGDAIATVAGLDGSLGGTPTVITPHDGEFEMLTGQRPGNDRIADARAAAGSTGAVVLLKGPTTVVASPDGDALLVDRGDERLATAGSGDVLAGLIGAALGSGVDPLHAAAAAAWLHADAAGRCPAAGLLAGDIVDALPDAIEALR